MISMLDPEVKATEIHRNTPFEFEATAEPQQFVQGCAQPVPFENPKVIEVVLVNLIPRLPKWIRDPDS